jgi:hypothetical protein
MKTRHVSYAQTFHVSINYINYINLCRSFDIVGLTALGLITTYKNLPKLSSFL